MADDKRDGSDDLFEDLDKFFAPIQDVDWPEPDEPASAPASPPPPAEEHVAVHVEPAAPPPEQDEHPAEETVVVATEDDAAWYDTGVLETVDATDDEDAAAGVVPDDTSVSRRWPRPWRRSPRPPTSRPPPPTSPARCRTSSSSSPRPRPRRLSPSPCRSRTSRSTTEIVAVTPADGGDDLFGDLAASGTSPDDGGEDDILSDLEEPVGAPRTVKVGSEGLGGPSWQEPASVEVGADLDRRGPNAGERDVPAAFLTGLVLAGIALGSLLIGRRAVRRARRRRRAAGAGRAVRRAAQASSPAGDRRRPRDGRARHGRRVLPGRERDARHVRARRRRHVPVVPGGAGRASEEPHREHGADALRHRVHPAARRLPPADAAHDARRRLARHHRHRAHARLRHGRVPRWLGLRRRLDPTPAGAGDQSEEVVGGDDPRHRRHGAVRGASRRAS